MLELAGREALGVHVGELLELERAFEGHRVADVAAEEQHRRAWANRCASSRTGSMLGEHPRHQIGHGRQLAVFAHDLVAVLGAASLRQRQADQLDGGDLGQERLGRGDADLGAGVGVEHRVGLARDLRAVGVADREHLGPLLPGVPHRLQGVGRLAGLADRDHQRLRSSTGSR